MIEPACFTGCSSQHRAVAPSPPTAAPLLIRSKQTNKHRGEGKSGSVYVLEPELLLRLRLKAAT